MQKQQEGFSVRLLGRPALTRDGATVALKRKKVRAIVYYLAGRSCALSRDHLCAVFWPEFDDAAARRNLNVCLYEIRQQAGGLIRSEDGYVCLAEDARVDAQALRQAESQLENDADRFLQAIEGCGEPFLDGFDVEDSPDFEAWKASEARYYKSAYLKSLAHAAVLFDKKGEAARSISLLRKIVDVDPLQESAYRALMSAYERDGNVSAAVQTYQLCARTLEKELSIAPAPETQHALEALLQRARRARPAETAPHPAPTATPQKGSARSMSPALPAFLSHLSPSDDMPFVGRSSELESALSLLSQDGGALVHLNGAAGIGKTRFVQEVIQRWDGYAFYAPCATRAFDPPYQPFANALASGLPELSADILADVKSNMHPSWRWCLNQILPDIGPADADGGQSISAPTPSQYVRATSAFFGALRSHGKVLVVFDDLHQASEETAGLILDFVTDAAQGNISLLVTQNPGRTNAATEKKRSLARPHLNSSILTIGPLSREDVGALAQACTGSASRQIADWLFDKSLGNPYIAHAYALYARDVLSNADTQDDAVRLLAASNYTPPDIERYLDYVYAQLSPNANQLLNFASACGASFAFETAAWASGLYEGDALDAIEELMGSSIVVANDDGSYRFHHRELADYAFRRMSPPRRNLVVARIEQARGAAQAPVAQPPA